MIDVKPRDSGEEEHGFEGDAREDASHIAVAPALPQGGFARNASGVVAAAGVPASRSPGDDDLTTVDPASLPLSGDQQEALARRIRHALGQTLPLGTPVPGAVTQRGARSAYARTMILGGRQSPGLRPSEPPTPRAEERLLERREPSRPAGSAPAAPSAAVPPPLRAEPQFDRSGPDSNALRASFVREVGLPTAPPPRRSRRPNSAEEAEPGEADHEAFVLDRPLTVPPPPPGGTRPPGTLSAPAIAVANAQPRRDDEPLGVMLPPPPQPGDYEPASAPSSIPPAPRPQPSPAVSSGAASGRASAVASARNRPTVPRAPAPPLLSELPSANPFEGFEAPRESFAQRFLIVFVVALAVVGMFALAAIAFGFLGKTTGW